MHYIFHIVFFYIISYHFAFHRPSLSFCWIQDVIRSIFVLKVQYALELNGIDLSRFNAGARSIVEYITCYYLTSAVWRRTHWGKQGGFNIATVGCQNACLFQFQLFQSLFFLYKWERCEMLLTSLTGWSHFVQLHNTSPSTLHISSQDSLGRQTMILVLGMYTPVIALTLLLPLTNYQATGSNTLPWTPETSVIDLLMRNLERIGDALHWLEEMVNWCGSLDPISEDCL